MLAGLLMIGLLSAISYITSEDTIEENHKRKENNIDIDDELSDLREPKKNVVIETLSEMDVFVNKKIKKIEKSVLLKNKSINKIKNKNIRNDVKKLNKVYKKKIRKSVITYCKKLIINMNKGKISHKEFKKLCKRRCKTITIKYRKEFEYEYKQIKKYHKRIIRKYDSIWDYDLLKENKRRRKK